MRAIFAALVAATLVFMPSAPADAQPKKGSSKLDPKTTEAKKLFEEGVEAYAKGNYEDAIKAWEESYEISKKSLIFESIANAYERLGDPKKARDYLQRWRDVAPKDEHELLDTRLKNLEARIAREEELEAARKKAEAEKAEKGGGEEKETPSPKDTEKPTPAPVKPSGGGSVPGMVLLGAGSAAVAVGVTLDVIAAIRRPDVTTACGPAGDAQICRASERDGISSSNTLAMVGDALWIVGGLAAATGLVLVITHKETPSKESAASTWIAPLAAPRGAGLSLSHTF